MTRLAMLAAVTGVLAVPGSAAATHAVSDPEGGANGVDCSHTTTGAVGPVGVQAGDGGTTGTADTAVGGCVNTGTGTFEGGSLEVGTGGAGTYAVIDGDNDNTLPNSAGYMGLSSYEDGNTDATCADGPDDGGGSSTNNGKCFGVDGGPWVDLSILPIRPICGNTSGPTWNNTDRDGCSNP